MPFPTENIDPSLFTYSADSTLASNFLQTTIALDMTVDSVEIESLGSFVTWDGSNNGIFGNCQGWSVQVAGTTEQFTLQVYAGAEPNIRATLTGECVYAPCVNSEVNNGLADPTQAYSLQQTNQLNARYFVQLEAMTIDLPTVGIYCSNTHV